jgi:cell division protease FtsH
MSENDKGTPPPQQPSPYQRWLLYAVAVMIFTFFYLALFRMSAPQSGYSISYTEFKTLVKDKQVDKVSLSGDSAEGVLFQPKSLGPQGESTKFFHTRLPSFGDQSLLSDLEAAGVDVSVVPVAKEGVFTQLLIGFAPWLLMLLLFFWLMRRAARTMGGRFGGPDGLKDFLQSPAGEAKVPEVTFEDVAGQENAKREITELVEYLKNPDKFRKLGAEIPRGVLLMGPPGTGKTLLARALAGEAGVPFYSISGSEFIEVFVGVGASRVRHLFEAAKKNAPSIIFIDELDSIGRTRGTGLGGGHDEREQTLNQILAAMDGFSGHEAVLVLAATNRPDVLDPALLRPGRFDRHVALDLPDINDRIAILKIHSHDVPVATDVALDKIAAGTPGFSGADLKNLVNEAAIQAARHNEGEVAMADFDEARDKVLMGTERSLVIQPDERHRLAVHESGHTVVAHYLPYTDALYKVTIVPRGQALGGTHQIPEHERHTMPEEYLRDRLAVMLGGRVAEKELLGSLSSGADNDIHQATQLARAMVSRWGMSDEVGPVDLRESEEHPFLGREMAQPRHYSEHSAEVVDDAVRQLLLNVEERALKVVREHRAELDELITALEKEETLYQEQIEECLGPATPKKNLTLVSHEKAP